MKNRPPLGRMKHTDPNFWPYLAAYLLLTCGAILFVNGFAKWAMDQSNTSILNTSFIAGCAAIFVGSIAFAGTNRRTQSKPMSAER